MIIEIETTKTRKSGIHNEAGMMSLFGTCLGLCRVGWMDEKPRYSTLWQLHLTTSLRAPAEIWSWILRVVAIIAHTIIRPKACSPSRTQTYTSNTTATETIAIPFSMAHSIAVALQVKIAR